MTSSRSLEAFQSTFHALAFSSPDTLAQQLGEASPGARLFGSQPINRLRQYQWMVYANHAETLETIYPYTHQLLQEDWSSLVRQYLREHPPQTYHLFGMAEAFPDYLAHQPALMTTWPFLAELARYELLEADILRLPDPVLPEALSQTFEPLTDFCPFLNPAARAFSADYPIQAIVAQLQQHPSDSAALTAIEPVPLWLWVYRDEHFDCRFFQVNPFLQSFLTRALEASAQERLSYQALLLQTADDFGMADVSALTDPFSQLLPKLQSLGILLGSVAV